MATLKRPLLRCLPTAVLNLLQPYCPVSANVARNARLASACSSGWYQPQSSGLLVGQCNFKWKPRRTEVGRYATTFACYCPVFQVQPNPVIRLVLWCCVLRTGVDFVKPMLSSFGYCFSSHKNPLHWIDLEGSQRTPVLTWYLSKLLLANLFGNRFVVRTQIHPKYVSPSTWDANQHRGGDVLEIVQYQLLSVVDSWRFIQLGMG